MNTFRFLEWIIDAFYHFLKLSRLICKLFLRYCITVGKTNVVKIVNYHIHLQICKYRYVPRMKQTTINLSIKMNQAGHEYIIEHLTYRLWLFIFKVERSFFSLFYIKICFQCVTLWNSSVKSLHAYNFDKILICSGLKEKKLTSKFYYLLWLKKLMIE